MNVNILMFFLFLMIFIKILLKIILYIYCWNLKKIKIPNPKLILQTEIINSYLKENNLNINIIYDIKKTFFIFKNFKKEKFICSYINDKYNSIYEIDYILGRLWLVWFEKHNKKQFNLYKFFAFYFYFIANILFTFIIITEFILIFLNRLYYNNSFFEFMNNHNLYFIISFLGFIIYLFSFIFNYYIKKILDKNYEKNLDNFLLKYFYELMPEFILVRKYHRKIPLLLMPIWFFNILNNSNVNLGPFTSIC